jgi:hypothetical protein
MIRRFLIQLSSLGMNNMVSSAYYSDKIPPGLNPLIRPLIRPLSEALTNILFKASPTKLKRRGERGSLASNLYQF